VSLKSFTPMNFEMNFGRLEVFSLLDALASYLSFIK